IALLGALGRRGRRRTSAGCASAVPMAGLVTAVFIVLTCNIVTGIMIGFATLVIGRLVSGEWRKLNIGTVVIAVALVTFYAGGWAI
ncbi:hypothetical protein AAIH63_34170, partial [Pseudomonas aeruginosa]